MRGGRPVVIITGANGGIGLEAVRSLLGTGARVGALDVATDALDPLAGRHACSLMVCRCDVRREDEIAAAVRRVAARWGGVDVVINNAAVAPFGRVEEMSVETVQNVLDVNLLGYVRTVQAVLPLMKAQGGGRIVNVASMLSAVGLPSLPAYAASKGAVEGFTRSLALDMRRYGITVSLFHPPSTRTPAARPLCLPKACTGDPVKVGAALARSVRSRRLLILADLRTAVLVAATRLVPGLFGRILTRLVEMSQAAERRSRPPRPARRAAA